VVECGKFERNCARISNLCQSRTLPSSGPRRGARIGGSPGLRSSPKRRGVKRDRLPSMTECSSRHGMDWQHTVRLVESCELGKKFTRWRGSFGPKGTVGSSKNHGKRSRLAIDAERTNSGSPPEPPLAGQAEAKAEGSPRASRVRTLGCIGKRCEDRTELVDLFPYKQPPLTHRCSCRHGI
jgi:hypothetical protein